MDSVLVYSCVYLSLIGVILCKDPMTCHTCSSIKQPECADEFGGNDKRFLVSCNDTISNVVVTCRKEVNKVMPARPTIFTRGCYYSDGNAPDDEIETYQIAYYTCSTPACNGMSKINSSALMLGFTTILLLIT